MSKNHTFYDTVVKSPQWKAWYEEIMRRHSINADGGKWEDNKTFDIDESQECGWLGDEHFQEFIKFCCATQQAQMREEINKERYDNLQHYHDTGKEAGRQEGIAQMREEIANKYSLANPDKFELRDFNTSITYKGEETFDILDGFNEVEDGDWYTIITYKPKLESENKRGE
jgi:hypothetical protein